MSQKNQVSAIFTEDEEKKVKEALELVSQILGPKLYGLSKQERKVLSKMSDKTVPFGDKVASYCITNPEFAPLYMDVIEMKKDLDLYKSLKPVMDVVKVLNSDISDTMMLTGSEAYQAARFYYHSVKYAGEQGNLAAKPIHEDLAKRFPGVSKKKKGEEEAGK